MGVALGARIGASVTAPAVSPAVYNATTTTRGRLYYYHGLNSTYSQLQSTPFLDFITSVRADGWQVILPGEMYDGASQSSGTATAITNAGDSGMTFRSDVIALHHLTRTYINQLYGQPVGGKDVIAGISWGGLMTEILVTSGVPVRAFLAHVPATDPHYLTEFSAVTTTNVMPTSYGSRVEKVPGWISYSTSDTRVGYAATQTLAANMAAVSGATITVRGGAGDTYYQSLGHSTDSTVISDMAAWVAAYIP